MLALLIRFYQKHLTQHTHACPNGTNGFLSCSAYGALMAEAHGSVRAVPFISRRVANCGAAALALGASIGDPCEDPAKWVSPW